MKYLIVLITILIHNAVSADEWSSKSKVTEIYSGYKEGFILFKLSTDTINPGTCADPSLYSVEAARADVNSILSILLAAQKSGSDVKVAVSSGHCGTGNVQHLAGKPSISRIASF